MSYLLSNFSRSYSFIPCFPWTQNVILCLKRHKGHSKWQNIRHIKAANDLRLSRLKNRYNHLIGLAIKQNGNKTDPVLNRPLAKLIEEALALDIPKANIDKAIKNASNIKDNVKEYLFEIRGPCRSAILAEILVTGRGQADTLMNALLKKQTGVQESGIRNLFDRKGLIEIEAEEGLTLDMVEEAAIDFEAEEVEEIKSSDSIQVEAFRIICDAHTFFSVKKKVSELYNVSFAHLTYISRHFVELEGRDASQAQSLIEALEVQDYVLAVYHNIL